MKRRHEPCMYQTVHNICDSLLTTASRSTKAAQKRHTQSRTNISSSNSFSVKIGLAHHPYAPHKKLWIFVKSRATQDRLSSWLVRVCYESWVRKENPD